MILRGKFISYKAFRFLLITALIVAFSANVARVQAAAVTNFSDTMSTIQDGTLANHTFAFTIQDSWQAGETLTLDFPAGFANTGFANTEPEDFDVTDDGVDQTLVASGGCSGAAIEIEITTVDTSDPIGFTFTRCATDATIAASSVVTIEIGTNATAGSAGNDQITNQSAAQNTTNAKITLTGGGGFTDTGTVAVEVVSNNNLAVTGTVDPQITCSIDDNTAAFGTFTLATVTTADSTPIWTISTNATNGYNLSVRSVGNSTNAGLYSSAAGYVIKSADSAENSTSDLSVSATIGYGLQGTKTNGDAGSATTTIQSPYTSTTTTVGRLQLTAQALASATGPVSNATITTTLKAKVTAFVPAGSYVDTVTYVCTGIY